MLCGQRSNTANVYVHILWMRRSVAVRDIIVMSFSYSNIFHIGYIQIFPSPLGVYATMKCSTCMYMCTCLCVMLTQCNIYVPQERLRAQLASSLSLNRTVSRQSSSGSQVGGWVNSVYPVVTCVVVWHTCIHVCTCIDHCIHMHCSSGDP